MEIFWFCASALMLGMYVVLDGFDLGAGAVHLWAAGTPGERKMVLRSIGPVWDGNEVWLLAAGGVLYFAFPALYASSFSGFYLPLMIVLWLLILRGIAIEFRNHLDNAAWVPFWDAVFSGSSLLLAVFFGAALGNVVRGVPLDEEGRFFEPLWTDFMLGPDPGILDWYTLTVGLAALCALALHGALWLWLKLEGEVERRARSIAGMAWPAVGVMTALITVETFMVQPQVPANLRERPWGWIFPLAAVGGWAGAGLLMRRGRPLKAFLSSCIYLLGMLTSAAFGLYPYVLPSITDPSLGLTVQGAAAPPYGLKVGILWWLPGMALVTFYFVFTYRRFAGKVGLDEGGY